MDGWWQKKKRATNDEGESPSPSPLPEGEGIKDLNHSGWLVGSWMLGRYVFRLTVNRVCCHLAFFSNHHWDLLEGNTNRL